MPSPDAIEVRPPRPHQMAEYYRLRWLLLRQPKGLPLGSERDALDDSPGAVHLAAFVPAEPGEDPPSTSHMVGPRMVGVGRLQLLEPLGQRAGEHAPPGSVAATDYGTEKVAQARYMGVLPQWRRHGVGTALAKAIRDMALKWGCTRIVADAREEALAYYLAWGCKTVSDEYYIKDIGPHYRVEYRL